MKLTFDQKLCRKHARMNGKIAIQFVNIGNVKEARETAKDAAHWAFESNPKLRGEAK